MSSRLAAPLFPAAAFAAIAAATAGLGFLLSRDAALLTLGLAALAAAAVACAIIASERAALVLFAFFASAFPIARLELGPVPLYAIDAVVFLGLAGLVWRGRAHNPYTKVVLLYVLAWTPAWLHQLALVGFLPETFYGFARTLLAVSAFFVAYAVARNSSLTPVLAALALGTILTALLALAQALAATGADARSLLELLAPDFVDAGYQSYPDRSFALFAAATTLSGFLAVMAPLLVALLAEARGRIRMLAGLGLVLLVPALLATYSRQWLPALLAGLLVYAALRVRRLPRLLFAVAALAVVGVLAFAAGALDRGYFGERFSSVDRSDPNIAVRLERQHEFFAFARDDPAAIMLGRGFASADLIQRDVVGVETGELLTQGGNENAFLLEVLDHGLVAGLVYAAFVVFALVRLIGSARRLPDASALLAALAAALVVAACLHLLDNYFSQAVFMKALFWLLLGLALGLRDRLEARAAGLPPDGETA